MKKILFISLSFLIVNVSVAQTLSNKAKSLPSFVNSILQFQTNSNSFSEQRVSALSERVIGQCTRKNLGWTRTDSTKLIYIVNGTSKYDFNQLLYPYNYPYSTSPMFNYLGNYTKPQIFYKSFYHWTVNPNTLVYGFYEKNFTTYTSTNNLVADTVYYADSLIRPNMTFSNKFNSNNDIDTAFSYNLKSGITKNAFRQFFTYDISNKLKKDSIYEFHMGTWHLVSKTSYSYDASDNLVLINNYSNNTDTSFTAPLIEQLRYVNTYDASNRLKTVETSYFDGTILKPYVNDTFAYAGSSTFHTSWVQHQYDAINLEWNPIIKMDKHLNTLGYPDTVRTYDYNTFTDLWIPSSRYLLSYNSNNNPTKLFEYQYNFTSFPSTPNFTTTYYYESFVNTTGLSNSKKENDFIIAYPNPCNDELSIIGIDNKHQNVFVLIYDAQGKLVSKQFLPVNNNKCEVILSEIKPGNYFIELQDVRSNSLTTKEIIKN